MMTRQLKPMARQHDCMIPTAHQLKIQRRLPILENVEVEPDHFASLPMDHVVLAIKKITQRPSTHRTTNPNTKQSGPNFLRFQRHIPRVKTPPIQPLATVPESHRWEALTPIFPE